MIGKAIAKLLPPANSSDSEKNISFDRNPFRSGTPAIAPAATVATGNTRYYQLHYRNPNAGFCPPETFNISNGYRVTW